ncbi:MAG: hypothetical protein O3C00_01650 [Bacteroidetes bacterium]|jgi:hypothetical protein|nr:hypothetical protein [Bacteroidota bacterium]
MKEERKKRTLQLAFWTWTWVITLAMATFGPKILWAENNLLTALAIGINLANGIGMILANRKLFNHYDELERKIHLESMAFTLGASVVVGLSYSLIDQTNLINADAEIGFLVMFIGITYMLALLINRKRYL